MAEVSESNIQVFVRIRPPSDEEPSYSRVVEVNHSETQIVLKQGQTPRVFSFDYVADVDARQETIFNTLGKKVIENCIAGYNGTIFAYGQTGSGKTFTMLGPSEDTDNFQDELRGVIPRSFEYLFSLIKREKELHGENKQFLCKCSFLEIYNEQIFDLLEPSPQVLHLRESLKAGVYVSGLSEQIVVDASEAYQLLNSSWMNRRVASTSMNRESSRSHAVFTLIVESKEKKGGSEHIRTSQLNLVDLAGSESQKNTNATGLRLKEAGSINKSLSNLGNVIMCLVSAAHGKERHIPYRDSKLTFLLRASLGGNSKTSLIACVHSGHKFYAETLSTLQFAKRAKMIKNKAILNENAEVNIQQLQLEIKKLKEELTQYKSGALIPQEPASAPQVPVEPTPVLKKMFLQAMTFYQKAEMDKMQLENELSDQKKIADKIVRQKVMIIKFREDALKRYEEKKKGIEVPDKTVERLQEEIKMLQDEIAHHPLVSKYSSELQKLRKEMQQMKTSDDWLTKLESDHAIAKNLEQKYKELITEQKASEDEPLTTPQRNEMLSTATLEKVRSQNKDLESENTMLKQSLNDTKEEFEQKVKKLSDELQWYENTVKDLQTVISANNTRNRIEMAQMTEKHLQTVISITTPKKGKNKDSPLNTTIPYEDPAMTDEGIIGENAPEELVEQANEAFSEQIKQQQETISNLEMRISEYDRDRIENVQTISLLESRLSQTEELLEKEKKRELAARQKLLELEGQRKEDSDRISRDAEEINDLRMVLNSADNELKDMKQKYKTVEASRLADKETFNTQLEKLERKLEQTEKEIEKLFEMKEELKNELEIEKDTSAFHVNLCSKLEDNLKEKDAEILKINSKLQTSEEKLMEERLLHENESNQLSTQGMQKEQLYLDQCAENTKLQQEIDELRVQIKKSKESEEHLKKISKQAEEKINSLYMRIQEESDKQIELQQTVRNLTEQLEMSSICDEQNQNQIKQLKKVAESMAENHELDKRKQETKMELLQEDLTSLQTLNDSYRNELTELQEKIELLGKDVTLLKKENTELNESLVQRREQSKLELSSKEIQYQDASLKINNLTALVLNCKAENQSLKNSLEDASKEKADCLKTVEDLKYQNRELHERNENQNERIAELNNQISETSSQIQSLRLDFDQKEKELTQAFEQLQEMQRIIQEKEDLEETVVRLTELAKKDNDEKLELRAKIEEHEMGIKQIQSLLTDGQETDLSDTDYVHHRIKSLKKEYDKLLEENNVLIGHSNHRQKIKYHTQVKNENFQLKKDVIVWQTKFRHLHEDMVRQGMLPRVRHEPLLESGKENVVPEKRMFLSGDYTKKS